LEDTTRWMEGAVGDLGLPRSVLFVVESARLCRWGMVGRFVSGVRAALESISTTLNERIHMGLDHF